MSAAEDFNHQPVMLAEITKLFADAPAGTLVDATLGGGGHAEAILNAHSHLDILGIDQDVDALTAAMARLDAQRDRLRTSHRRFNEFSEALAVHAMRRRGWRHDPARSARPRRPRLLVPSATGHSTCE